MLLSDLTLGLELYQHDIPNIEIEKITSKPEEIEKNTLLVLFQGIKFDTRKIINDIISKKPLVIVTDIKIPNYDDIAVLYVKNARKAYAYLMYNFCRINNKKIKFYAVTGTNGKTTTATMLFNIFSTAGIKCGFIGTGKILIENKVISDTYYSMTTPDPDILYPIIKRMENEGCEKVVMEVSSHALALFKVAPLVFECSVFTNLSEEHLDFHKSKEEYFNAKLSIFSQSKCGIFNLDDEYAKRALMHCKNKIETYSVAIKNCADAMAKDIWFNAFKSTSYIYREKKRIFKITLFSVGEHNISNSLLAIKCALIENISHDIIQESFFKEKTIDGRFEIVCKSPTVIIDYAHTCAAFENVIKFIKAMKNIEQNIITVFGCGGERDKSKRPKMARISEMYSDFSIITSDNSRSENLDDIISEIELGFSKNAKYTIIKNRKKAIEYSIRKARGNDIVLIIGKGHEKYTIDAEGYHRFDERDIISQTVKEPKS